MEIKTEKPGYLSIATSSAKNKTVSRNAQTRENNDIKRLIVFSKVIVQPETSHCKKMCTTLFLDISNIKVNADCNASAHRIS